MVVISLVMFAFITQADLFSQFLFNKELNLTTTNLKFNKLSTSNNPELFERNNSDHSFFDSSPFGFLIGYFGVEHLSVNENYWNVLFNKYNLPTEKASSFIGFVGFSTLFRNFNFDCNFGINEYSSNSNDTLKSNLSSTKLNFNFGYNLIQNERIFISTFIGLQILWQYHTISMKNDTATIGQLLKHPDFQVIANQSSALLGINILYKFFRSIILTGNFGYNINLNKFPALYSDKTNIYSENISLLKNYFIGIGFGVILQPEHIDN